MGDILRLPEDILNIIWSHLHLIDIAHLRQVRGFMERRAGSYYVILDLFNFFKGDIE